MSLICFVKLYHSILVNFITIRYISDEDGSIQGNDVEALKAICSLPNLTITSQVIKKIEGGIKLKDAIKLKLGSNIMVLVFSIYRCT